MKLNQIVNLDIELTKENNYQVQNLILYLTIVGAVKQEDAREVFFMAEEMNETGFRRGMF